MPDSKPSPVSAPSNAEADRLRGAADLAKWLAGAALAGALVVALGPLARSAVFGDAREAWTEALAREVPALWPAGRVERLPGSDPSIRTDFGPGLRTLAPPLAERR